MSYRDPQTDVVLTGSLNLLAPSNLTPKEDAIALQNWRVDQAGALRSRLWQTLYASPGGRVHTIFQRDYPAPAATYYGSGPNLYRDTTLVTGSLDGNPVGLANMNGYTWIMNPGIRGRDSGSGLAEWGVPAATDPPTLAGLDGGELVIDAIYTYWITWVNANGEESNPGPSANYTPNNPQQNCQITRPTPPAWAVSWNLYRAGDTLPQPYRVNDDVLPVAQTTFVDDGGKTPANLSPNYGRHSDEALEQLGFTLDPDNDPPPAASGLIGPYFDRLIAFRSAEHPNWFWWSKQARPYAFPGADLDEGNHAPVGDDGEDLVTATLHPRQVRFYKARSIWRMTGDPDEASGELEQVDTSAGIIGVKAIASRGELDYYQGAEGIYVCNGYTSKKVSAKLDPLFKGDPVNLPGATASPLGSSRTNNTLEIINGRLYFSYATAGQTDPNATLVYDIDGDRWYSEDRGFTALAYLGQGRNLLGAISGAVYALEQASGATWTNLVYQTGYRDQETRDRLKTYADVAIEYSVAAHSYEQLAVTAYYDDGLTTEALGFLGVAQTVAPASGKIRTVFKMGGGAGQQARSCSIRIEGAPDVAVIIYSVTLHYYFEARDALTFDTDESDLGSPLVKRYELIYLDIDATAAVTWKLLTDKPGGAMTVRSTGTIAATTGRAPIEIPLDADLPEGRLMRLELSGAGIFRLYRCRIRYRPIAMYIDVGEQYATLELAA